MDFLTKFNAKIDLLNKIMELQLKLNAKYEVEVNNSSIVPTEPFISIFQINRDVKKEEEEYFEYVAEFENEFHEKEKEFVANKEFYESLHSSYFKQPKFHEVSVYR